MRPRLDIDRPLLCLPPPQNSQLRAEDIHTCLAGWEASAEQRPASLFSGHPLWSDCYARNGSAGWARCPWHSPCECRGGACDEMTSTLGLGTCFLSLPAGHLGILHFVRSPADVVVSAYLYHSQLPAPEAWIDEPVSWGRLV